MTRLPDWRSRLNAAIEAARPRPFDEDAFHCAFFAADMVEAMTGVDPAAPFRGLSRLAAERVLREAGVNLVGYVARLFAEVHPSRAALGDIAAIAGEGGPALGIVLGAEIMVPAGDGSGLGTVPLTDALRAFRV